MPKKILLTPESMRCSACMLSTLCLPIGIEQNEVFHLDEVVNERIRIPKGKALFHQGDVADAIYGIRSGSIKTQLVDSAGLVQITGFLLAGELVGLDGFLEESQLSTAIALEDTEVCVARIDDMDRITAQVPALQYQLRRLTSNEIKRSQQLVMSLGVLRSEQRLAGFLLSISQRLAVLGYSPSEFVLRMSREEIGNYLGLTLETVSRLFSRFARENLLRVRQRDVQLLDMQALRDLAGTDCG
ncbi:helix-turn-helix domain-containing protein [Eoetvoesiella caeni]